MSPTIGRIVHYTLSGADVVDINDRRLGTRPSCNPVAEGQVYPAAVVRTWGDGPEAPVNLRVLLDGDDAFWATSRVRGAGPGTWAWPPRS